MLEVLHRDGRARIASWQPSDEHVVTSPCLVVPETRQVPLPPWTEVSVTRTPTGRDGVVELVSAGTWFYEDEDASSPLGLVVRPPQPGPTTQVQVVPVGEELAVFHDAAGWASNPEKLVPALVEARREATPGRLLWAPGLGVPADYAVWSWLGVDLFDASPLMLAAARGVALTVDGPLPKADAEALYGDGAPWDTAALTAFNLEQASLELRRVQHAVRTGSLRQLAERRAPTHPDTVALLRRFDAEHGFLEAAAPVHAAPEVPCMTWDSLWMPAVERFRRRVRDAYTPPASADVLVLLPCSARKPYRLSKTHRYFQRALDDSGVRHRVHEVMVTSPLGLVPRELEDMHPANKYDVPVTGHWNGDEEELIRTQLAALLEAGDYKHVVAHVPASTFTFLRDLLPDGALHTAHGRPSSKADCDRLRDVLRNIKTADPRKNAPGFTDAKARKLEDVQGIASFQFGAEVAEELCAGGTATGRVPYVKLTGPDGKQRGQTSPERGLLSLTLAGAEVVARHETKRVHIGDFWIRKTGSLFAVGVDGADADVRPGDDVVVVHGDEVRGCGQALMSAEEMASARRGVAVQLRHIVKEPKKTATPQEVAA